MKKIILLIVTIILRQIGFGQTSFQKAYGGLDWDEGLSVQQTGDGGYIIAGLAYGLAAGNTDVYLIKTDAAGNLSWTKTFGGADADNARSVQQTTDGGYIIVGRTKSFGDTFGNVYLIKTDANGDTLWTKIYGGTGWDEGNFVQQTSDGGYIITGFAGSFGGGLEVYLIKTDANGNALWTKTYGGSSDWDAGQSVQQTSDGGYIISGWTESFGAGSRDVYVIKTDANGDTLWTKTCGGTGWDESSSVLQTIDGGYIITGYTGSFSAGDDDVYLIKLNANGNLVWSKTIGRIVLDWAMSIKQTTDGGYVITGLTSSIGPGGWKVFLIRSNVNGDTIWTKIFGSINGDFGTYAQQTADGGYIITGRTHSYEIGNGGDVYLIKTDSTGFSGCSEVGMMPTITTPATQISSPATIVTSPVTSVTVPATIVASGGMVTSICAPTVMSEPQYQNSITLFPNSAANQIEIPNSERTEIRHIEIYDVLGQRVFTQPQTSNLNPRTLLIDVSILKSGIYFIKLKGEIEERITRFVKE